MTLAAHQEAAAAAAEEAEARAASAAADASARADALAARLEHARADWTQRVVRSDRNISHFLIRHVL